MPWYISVTNDPGSTVPKGPCWSHSHHCKNWFQTKSKWWIQRSYLQRVYGALCMALIYEVRASVRSEHAHWRPTSTNFSVCPQSSSHPSSNPTNYVWLNVYVYKNCPQYTIHHSCSITWGLATKQDKHFPKDSQDRVFLNQNMFTVIMCIKAEHTPRILINSLSHNL